VSSQFTQTHFKLLQFVSVNNICIPMVKNALDSYVNKLLPFSFTVLATHLLGGQEFLQSMIMSDRVMRGQTVHYE
jgi:hypothetical protein